MTLPGESMRVLLSFLCGVAVAGCGNSTDGAAATEGGAGGDTGGNGASDAAASGSGGALGGSGGSRSNSDAGPGGPCSFGVPPVAPPAVSATATPEERAQAAALSTLDYLIGRYLRGDLKVYRGTAAARDNASELVNAEVYGPRPDNTIPDGPALALLDVRAPSSGDWNPPRPDPQGTSAYLVVHGLPADQHFILAQAEATPDLTEASLLSGVATTASLATSCSACAPDLLSRPETISFQDLTATGTRSVLMGYAGQGGQYVDVTARLIASADLAAAPVCSITFDDLVVLNSATGPNQIDLTMSSFVKNGSEMTWRTGGSFQVGGAFPCPLMQAYTIEAFVDLRDLSHYGTRNYTAGTPTAQCVPGAP